MLKRLFRGQKANPGPTVPINLTQVLNAATPRAIALWLTDSDHDVLDQQVGELSEEQAARLCDYLTPVSARELLESISPHTGLELLRKVPVPVAAGLLDAIEADDAARVIELMGDEERHRVLEAMKHSHSALVRGLLAWPDDSAASRMRPEFLQVGPDATMADAVGAARIDPDDLEEGVFVTENGDSGKIALGWLSPNSMVLAKRADPVSEHMVPATRIRQWSVKPLADQETVSHRVRERDSDVIAVMDGDHILGVITQDTVRNILAEEATEDAELQGGSSPLDVPYMQASPIKLWTKRVGWLLVLFIAEMYTSNVLAAFEDEFAKVTALVLFVPLLVGTGGNVGTQITTTLVRAMATEDVRLGSVFKVIWKEVQTGVLLGLTMATAGFIRAWTLGVVWPVMITVAVALAAIVLWASFVASILPVIIKSVKLDPAVVSGPMIATVVDGTGLIIYFLVAQWLIPGL